MSGYLHRVFLKSCEDMCELPDGVVQTCVTSPPYFGLRTREVEGEIGHEPTPGAYVARLVAVCREIRRVLREDGTLWLNLGDSYAAGGAGQYHNGVGNRPEAWLQTSGLKAKDLLGIPWATAFALREDGWWLRDAIVWAKPNPMPNSVDDRCTSAYEMVFMLAKAHQYYADMAAVAQPLGAAMLARIANGPVEGYEARAFRHDEDARFGKRDPNRALGDQDSLQRIAAQGANLRNVWTIAPTRYRDSHFATFPIELASRCLLIGSRVGDLILDPFMGSGTTAEAAQALGRVWTGYEVNPRYHRLIEERTRQAGLFGAAAVAAEDDPRLPL